MLIRSDILLSCVLIVLIMGTVSAAESICTFNGSVSLDKGDLAAYTSDQIGCAIQQISESFGILLILAACLLVLLFIYGLYKKK